MIIEGVFDGSTVRPIGTCTLEQNQRVFINVPNIEISSEKSEVIKQKLNAVNDIFGILNSQESKELDESINKGIHFKTFDN